MVDGGILSNYPIWIFDSPTAPRWPTFGFHFVKDEIQADPARYNEPISMFKGLFKTMMQAHDLRHLDKESKARTITIPTGTITSTNFELTKEEKEWLYNSGYNSANKFYKLGTLGNILMNIEKGIKTERQIDFSVNLTHNIITLHINTRTFNNLIVNKPSNFLYY